MKGMKTMDIEGFIPDFNDESYRNLLGKQMKNRVEYLESLKKFKDGRDSLPNEAIEAIEKTLK